MPFVDDSPNMPFSEFLKHTQNRIMTESTYMGIATHKTPFDFWIYQEIFYERHPDVIIDIGTHHGGTALSFAHLCDNLNHGRVVSMNNTLQDVSPLCREHKRVTLFEGNPISLFDVIKATITPEESVMVIEDTDHTLENTLSLLRAYSKLVTRGNYFIVEDSICHHGLDVGPNPGPYEAICQFLKENNNFVADRTRESFIITWNPMGFLKRVL